MVPINPHFARSIASQRIQEHLDQAATRELAAKGTRLHLGALLPMLMRGRQSRTVRLGAQIPGRAY